MTTTNTGTGDTLVGKRMPRLHDARMLRGHGRYVDDIDETGVLHAAIVRSPAAHGTITRFDATAARGSGDAVLVLGPDEIGGLTDPLPITWPMPGQHLGAVELAIRTVRYVGQPIGVVVARSRAVAEDLAELVEVDIDPLPAVIGIAAALAPDAPVLYPEHGSNVAGGIHFGPPVEDLDALFADAAYVVEREFTVQRVNPSPLEPRGVLAEWIPNTEQLTVWASTQVPHLVRQEVAVGLRLRVDQVRVVTRTSAARSEARPRCTPTRPWPAWPPRYWAGG